MIRCLLAVAVLGALAACAGRPASAPASQPVAQDDAIDAYVKAWMARKHVPGVSIAVVRGDRIIKTAAYGLASIEFDVPMTTDTLIRLDSTNKLFTAVAIMMLAHEGKLDVDDPVSKFFPEAPATWKGVTLRHLLTHTSGIKDYYAEEFHGSMLVDYQVPDMIRFALSQPALHPPGAVSEYNNMGFFLLTQVVERASGMPYHQFMVQRVYEPAGMTQWSFDDPATVVSHLAPAYAMRDGKVVFLRDYEVSNCGESYSLKSTAADVARFHLALVSGKLIDKATLDLMRERQMLTSGMRGDYGMAFEEGLRRGWPFYGKGGRSGAVYRAYPGRDLAVVVLGNLDSWTGHVGYEDMASDIAGLVDPALAMPDPPPPDPDGKGAAMRARLVDIFTSGNPDPPGVDLRWFHIIPPEGIKEIANGVMSTKGLELLACDPVHVPWESWGMQVATDCEYQVVADFPGPKTVQFQLAADGTLIEMKPH